MLGIKISIIIPSFNQGSFIEKAIKSVLDQGCDKTELIIIDGGSTDNSVEIMRKYDKDITYWESKKDRGQSHAINKGLKKITGDFWAYLNSDDYYLPNTFNQVIEAFNNGARWVTGSSAYVNSQYQVVEDLIPEPVHSLKEALIRFVGPKRPISIEASNFMHRSVLDEFGHYREDLHYCMDYEYNLRLFRKGIKPIVVNSHLSHALLHEESKTVSSKSKFLKEEYLIIQELVSELDADDKIEILSKWNDYPFWNTLSDKKSVPAWIKFIASNFLKKGRIRPVLAQLIK